MTCPACAPHRADLGPGEDLRCAHCGVPARAPDADPTPAQGTSRGSALPGVVRAAPRAPAGCVYVAGDEANPPRPSVHGASGLAAVEDPELVRVRCLLAALRPEAVNPFVKPVREPVVCLPPAPSSRAPWDLERPTGAVRAPAGPPAEIVARLDTFSAGERALLGWIREEATLEKGLSGLYLDLAWAFPPSDETGARWHSDVSAGRIGGVAHGRHLVQSACTAWGIPWFVAERDRSDTR